MWTRVPLLFLLFVLALSQVNYEDLPLMRTIQSSGKAGGLKYFRTGKIPDIPDDQVFEIVLSSYTGDADIYVTNHLVPIPSKDNAHWKSNNQAGVDMIEISPQHPKYIKNGEYFILINTTIPSEYTLYSYVTNRSIIVQEATPQMARVKNGQFKYFRYYLPEDGDFYVSLTSITGARPIVYMDNWSNRRPNQNAYNWTQPYSDGFKISRTDYGYLGPGWYYIGITSDVEEIYFNLVVTHFKNATILSEGIYQHGEVEYNDYIWFKYRMVSNKDLKINMNVYSGIVGLYIGVGPDNRRPNEATADWYIWPSYNVEDLTIKATDPKFKNNEWYYIGAKGYDSEWVNEVHITAGTDSIHTQLSAGVPAKLTINTKDKYHWFVFYNDLQQNSLDITSNFLDGDGQIYVSGQEDNRFPTRDWNEKAGDKFQGTSRVTYLSPAKNKNYYIGVQAERVPFTFTLVATGANYATRLTSTYVYYDARKDSVRDFYYDVSDPNSDVTFSMDWIYGDGADVYIAPYPVNSTSYLWWFNSWWGSSITIRAGENGRTPDPQRLYLKVYARGTVDGFYGIVAFQSGKTTPISSGDVYNSPILPGQYHYYSYRMPNSGSFTVNVRCAYQNPSDPHVEVYVASETYESKPRRDKYQYTNRVLGDNNYVPVDDAWGPQVYVFGIYGLKNTTYQLRLSLDYESLDYWGYRMYDRVRRGRWRYFTIEPNEWYKESNNNMGLLSLTLIKGFTTMYISYNASQFPTNRIYDERLDTFPSHVIRYDKSDPNFKWNRWNIGVYGYTDSEFFISGNFADDFQANIYPGEPYAGYVENTKPSRFVIPYWMVSEKNLIIKVRALRRYRQPPGPKMSVYASQDYQFPNATNAKWMTENQVDRLDTLITKPSLWNDIYFTIYADAYQRILVTVQQDDAPVFLTQEKAYERFIPANKQHRYIMQTSLFSKAFLLSIESCDNDPPPLFYTSRRVQTPNETNGGRRSTSLNAYTQYQLRTDIKHDETAPIFYIAVQSPPRDHFYSVYGTTGDDYRPKIVDSKLVAGSVVPSGKTNNFLLTIPAAEDPIANRRSLRYFIYHKELKPSESIKNTNFYTECAVSALGTPIREFNPPESDPDYITLELSFPRTDKDVRYLFNVLVSNVAGLHSAYAPFELVLPGDGQPGIPAGTGFAVAFLVISIIAVVLIAAYITIGILVKKFVYGATGSDLIPNKNFWISIFGLIKRAVVFIFTCGRASAGYGELIEESDSKIGTDDVGQSSIQQTSEPAEQGGGYGTI